MRWCTLCLLLCGCRWCGSDFDPVQFSGITVPCPSGHMMVRQRVPHFPDWKSHDTEEVVD